MKEKGSNKPGTEPEAAKPEDKKKPRNPRSKEEVACDFRMASFIGNILKVAENWGKDRTLNITIETKERERATKGLDRFMSADEILFRLVPRQPLLTDKDPEDFSLKVPAFCMEMVQRLERKAAHGFSGWETMSLAEHVIRIVDGACAIQEVGGKKPDAVQIRKKAIDLANYCFFVHHLAGAQGAKLGPEA